MPRMNHPQIVTNVRKHPDEREEGHDLLIKGIDHLQSISYRNHIRVKDAKSWPSQRNSSKYQVL